jgi:hypothetical protein
LGALALLTFTVTSTLLAHGLRGLTGDKRQQQETTAFEHMAIVGGFLFVVIHGAGGLSVDNLLRQKPHRRSATGERANCKRTGARYGAQLVRSTLRRYSHSSSVNGTISSALCSLPALPDLAPIWRSLLAVTRDVTHIMAIQ